MVKTYNSMLLPEGFKVVDIKSATGAPGVEVVRISDNQTMTEPAWLVSHKCRRKDAVIHLVSVFNWHYDKGHYNA